jgi:hypothetical protein
MKYDVRMRVTSGPGAFDDVTVTVNAASGDEAALKAQAKAGSAAAQVCMVMPAAPTLKPTSKPKPKPKPRQTATRQAKLKKPTASLSPTKARKNDA